MRNGNYGIKIGSYLLYQEFDRIWFWGFWYNLILTQVDLKRPTYWGNSKLTPPKKTCGNELKTYWGREALNRYLVHIYYVQCTYTVVHIMVYSEDGYKVCTYKLTTYRLRIKFTHNSISPHWSKRTNMILVIIMLPIQFAN